MAENNIKNVDLDALNYNNEKIKDYVNTKVGTGGLTIDSELSETSENPVQNKVVTAALEEKASKELYADTTINVGRKADTTVGSYSTAEGYNTTASGTSSHSEGAGTVSNGNWSHAEGYNTTASGYSSHAEGYYTTARGHRSHSGGNNSIASGAESFAHGYNVNANNDNEVAFGIYNTSNTDTLFSVGDGTSSTDTHNAFEITTDGGKLHDKNIATEDNIPVEMTGATSSAAGTSGLVPAPTAGNQEKFLRGDGTWATPPDTDTHYTSKNVVGDTTATANTTTELTNGNVYLNSVENGAVTSSHKISGSGATTVTTDTSGNIVISSTDTNTTYTPATLGIGYGTCSTAEATTAKVVSLSNYNLITGGMLAIKFTYAVPASATLNVNSKGAKSIYYRGSAITANVIGAGDIGLFVFSGSYYRLIAVNSSISKLALNSYTTITINTSDWSTNSAGGYMYTYTPSAALPYSNFLFDIILSTDQAAAKLQIEAWNNIIADGEITQTTSSGSTTAITFYAFTTQPSVALTVAIQGVS